ncbi:MAG: hypothetical protein HFP77_01265 [Methylococcales symbiont of Iophon sp. n. MRB-2018]|nr:MAG: hypothetical protein HFP77_01265 [Methylococcales symbiont of Iophon sp. n. MRB-2018]KAF3980552.1 MAG: hypothetical protein HFP76_01485 [Methylococcales symbiont of Iophon sp. n. MRB-2018]
MLEIEIKYFEDNQSKLSKDYPNMFVLIKEKDLVGGFLTENEAMSEGARIFGRSNFLIRNVNNINQEVRVPALSLGIIHANFERNI